MSPETSRKVRAFMVIAMMVVAEGQRIDKLAHLGDMGNEWTHRATTRSSHDPKANSKAGNALDSATDGPIELDALFKSPGFVKQLEVMAGHMDKHVGLMKSKTSLLVQANEMTRELDRLTFEPSSYADSTLPKHMEAVFADSEFKKQAQAFAEDMQKSMKEWELADNMESSEGLEELTATMNSVTVSEKSYAMMDDPKFRLHQEQVSTVLDSLEQDADLQRQALSIAEYVESLKNSTQVSDEAQAEQVSDHIAAMLTNAKLREMASDVVLEVLRNDLKSTSMEWIAYLDSDELTSISEDPKVWEYITMEAQKSKITPPRSLLEVRRASAQEDGFAMPPLASWTVPQGRPAHMPQMRPALTATRNVDGRSRMYPRPAHVRGVLLSSLKAVHNEEHERLSRKSDGAGRSAASNNREGDRCAADDTLNQNCWEVSALTSAKGLRSMMPTLVKAIPQKVKGALATVKKQDFSLLLCLALWYLGSYLYNVTNKLALNAAGGVAGFPMTIGTLQLGIGALFALFMWLAPDARKPPEITFKDYVATLPLSLYAAGVQAASVYALSAGSATFAQIVRASQPAFAAGIVTLLYGTKISNAKWVTLIPVIGGVVLASLGELNFALAALISQSIANIFLALQASENSKLMKDDRLSERIGGVSNQFALMTINSFVLMTPLMLFTEGSRLGEFMILMKTDPVLQNNLFSSAAWSYVYTTCATQFVKKTNPVTQAVANTAGAVVFLVAMAVVMHESLSPLKMIGSGMAIGGVYLYTIIDKLVAARKTKANETEAGTEEELKQSPRKETRFV